MIALMDRDNVMPLDTRPEDRGQLAGPMANVTMNQIIRSAAGRLGNTPADPQLGEALALAEAGHPREAIALALRDDEPDALAMQFARRLLEGALGAEPLLGAGYEPSAALLRMTARPGSSAREAAAVTLLDLDGPGDAALAGRLVDPGVDGEELAALINLLRLRAGLPQLRWADGEAVLEA